MKDQESQSSKKRLTAEALHQFLEEHDVNEGDFPKLLSNLQVSLSTHMRKPDTEVPPDAPFSDRDLSQAELVTTTHLPAKNSSEGKEVLGRYQILEELGKGGMGAVYLAEQIAPVKRRVALKVIRTDKSSSEVLARFENERQAMALMNHSNIARIFDAGTTPRGEPFFVMELVIGPKITNYCDEHRLTIEERVQIFCQVCDGVQHAHQKGIIHRDLTPSNILVSTSEGKAVPKVIDFGLAKATQDGQKLSAHSPYTEIGQIVGTLKYMSPEQACLDAVDIDTRTDIYALGIILYELVLGSSPVDTVLSKRQNVLDVLEFIRKQDAARPSRVFKGLDLEQQSKITDGRRTDERRMQRMLAGDLDWIILKALEKDRSRRYENASSLAADLRLFLESKPIQARPPTLAYRVNKYVRRNRLGVIAASLVLLAMVVGIAGLVYGLVHAEDLRQQAEKARRDSDLQKSMAVRALVDSVLTASPEHVPPSIDRLKPFKKSATPILFDVRDDIDADQTSRLHAEYALSALGEGDAETVANFATSARVEEIPNILVALDDHPIDFESLLSRALTRDEKIRLATLELYQSRSSILSHLLEQTDFASTQSDFVAWAKACLKADMGFAQELDKFEASVLANVILAIGNVDPNSIEDAQRKHLVKQLIGLYPRRDQSGFIHGAVTWTLQGWRKQLPPNQTFDLPSLESDQPKPDDQWYVNSAGITMTRVPIEPKGIGERIAFVSSTEVTYEQFEHYGRVSETAARQKDSVSQNLTPIEPDLPIVSISKKEIAVFCNKLSQDEDLLPCYRIVGDDISLDVNQTGYRLLTSEEWTMACQAGTSEAFHFGNDATDFDQYEVFDQLGAHPVASLMPNSFGLFDTLGNVSELTWDEAANEYSDSGGNYWNRGTAIRQFRPASVEGSILVGFRIISLRSF